MSEWFGVWNTWVIRKVTVAWRVEFMGHMKCNIMSPRVEYGPFDMSHWLGEWNIWATCNITVACGGENMGHMRCHIMSPREEYMGHMKCHIGSERAGMEDMVPERRSKGQPARKWTQDIKCTLGLKGNKAGARIQGGGKNSRQGQEFKCLIDRL